MKRRSLYRLLAILGLVAIIGGAILPGLSF